MSPFNSYILNQYQGYTKTPQLWINHTVLGLKQFQMPKQQQVTFNKLLPNNLRLGKRVEQFLSYDLQQINNVKIVLENKQIQVNKRTIGELDCILTYNKIPIHLEVVYKFYLYDNRVGLKEIDHWIGPNRNDNLLKKLTKLKEKQLPLLYSEYTKPILDKLNLNAEQIKQQVYFKAQLFIPYNEEIPTFKLLNKDCLYGFYMKLSEIEQLKDCKFHIPSKQNWLSEIQIQIDWLPFSIFSKKVTPILKGNTSPLCWVKFPNGITNKFFVVWWS